MSQYAISEVFELIAAVWETRDACPTHYPHRCPTACPNAGQHNESLGKLCECRACTQWNRTPIIVCAECDSRLCACCETCGSSWCDWLGEHPEATR